MAVCPILSLLQKVRSCTFCTKLRCSVRYFCIKGIRKILLFIVYSKVSAAGGISIFVQKHDLTANYQNELSQRLFQCSFWHRYMHEMSAMDCLSWIWYQRSLNIMSAMDWVFGVAPQNSWNPFLVCREKKLKKYLSFMFYMAQRLIEL